MGRRVSSIRYLVMVGLLTSACADTDVAPDDTDVQDTDPRRDADADGAPASRDCDDNDANAYPGNVEICDEIDNDCDSKVDDEDDSLDTLTRIAWYQDRDGDGFGDTVVATSCLQPERTSPVPGDCDDRVAAINPDAAEVCNTKDDDCDTRTDDEDDDVVPATLRTWYLDGDGDGFGVDATAFDSCDPGEGGVGVPGDCDDSTTAVNPAAQEVCNLGVDDDCDNLIDGADPDVDPNSLFPVFRDNDRDSYGTGASVLRCSVDPGWSLRAGDCNDASLPINPDAAEVCDGADNNCKGGIDEADAWWDVDWPFRKLVRVAVPASTTLPAMPFGVDVDLNADLARLGDAGELVPGSIRVVVQSCALGQPRMPAELADGVLGAWGGSLTESPLGDGAGTLFVQWDDDEDVSSVDTPAANSTLLLGVYFASTTAPPASDGWTLPSGLSSFDTVPGVTISNATTRLDLADVRGGLPTRLSTSTFGSVGSLSTTNAGNGIQFTEPGTGTKAWVSARDNVSGVTSVVHAGKVAAIGRSSGTASGSYGGFTYVYDWLMFQGRREVYVRVRYVLDRAGKIAGTPSWATAVRPWFVNNTALVGLGTSEGDADTTGWLWARGAYDTAGAPFGVFTAWWVPPSALGRPVYDVTGTANAGRFVGVVGEDLEALPGEEVDGVAGDVILDDAWLVVIPHVGSYGGVSAGIQSVLRGVTITHDATTGLP